MLRGAAAALLLVSCVRSAPLREPCQTAYDNCLIRCFGAPNYKRNSPQCAQWATGQICPQADQAVDTIAAGKCLNACDWDAKLCR